MTTKSEIITNDGYAPRVPSMEEPSTADEYTLILMLRDSLQNGNNPTRGNLALHYLLEKLKLPVPERPLDPEPYMWDDGQRTSNPKAHDSIYGYPAFRPGFRYDQNRQHYVFKEGAI